MTQEEPTEDSDIMNLIQNCATLKNTTDNLKSLINRLLERIFSLESEVTAIKTSVKRFSQSELIQRATKDKTVVEIDPMSIKPVVPQRPKYYKQPNLTADKSAELQSQTTVKQDKYIQNLTKSLL